MNHEVSARIAVEQPTAVVTGTVAGEDAGRWLADAVREVSAYLYGLGVAAVGPPFARFTVAGTDVVVEAGLPVARPVAGHDRVRPSSLPGGPVAVAAHDGDYRRIGEVYDDLDAWLDEHGYRPAAPCWEVYQPGPDGQPDPTRQRTRVIAPYQVPA